MVDEASGSKSNPSISIPTPSVALELKQLRCQRAVLLGQLTKLKNNIASRLQELTEFELETKLGLLETQFINFNQTQSQIERLDEAEIDSGKRDLFEEAYCNVKAQMRQQQERLRPRHSFDTSMLNTTQCIQIPSQRRFNLQKLQLITFSGDLIKWMDFYNMFSTLIDENQDLSDIEKFQYLRASVTGNAVKVIQSLEITSQNYKEALKLLKARFDNKQYIFEAHIKEIVNLRSSTRPTTDSIRALIDTVNVNLRALKSIGDNDQIANGFLLNLLLSKVHDELRAKWEEEVAKIIEKETSCSTHNDFRYPTWTDLSNFLERRCKTLNMISIKTHTSSSSQSGSASQNHQSPKSRQTTIASAFIATETSRQCTFCDSTTAHSPFQCPRFTKLDVADRFKLVKDLKLCINCLRRSHTVQHCSSVNKCQSCGIAHHTMLHRDRKYSFSPYIKSSVAPLETNTTSHTPAITETRSSLQTNYESSQVILATALIQLKSETGISVVARAILDSASQLNFITEHIAYLLNAKRTKINLSINSVAVVSTKVRHQCHVTLQSLQTNFTTSSNFVILPEITTYQPHQHFSTYNWRVPTNVRLADPQFNRPSAIDVLIGAGLFYDLLAVGQFSLGEGLPCLQKTLLGWVIAGNFATTSQSPRAADQSTYHSLVISADTPSTDDLLKRFWVIEEHLNVTPSISLEEEECEEFFAQTTTRCSTTNKFIVRLPFKSNPNYLGDSYQIALKRLASLENKLSKDTCLEKEYSRFIAEYEELGHMKKVMETDAGSKNRLYIPHHSVKHLSSSSTKFRVVFDASCKTSTGKSLNDVLKVGPTLQDDLFTIITRFRTHRYVLMADITKMYRQILVDPRDAKFQNILWRESTNTKVKTFQLQTLTYGTSCAPYLAVRCLRQIAFDNSDEHPRGSNIILRDFYIDNLMTGAGTIQEVNAIKEEVIRLLTSASMPLRKFASNEEEIMTDIASVDREPFINIGDKDVLKALGLVWNPLDDSFCFSYTSSHNKEVTKRGILSEISKFFDPLGLLNPVIVKAKIFLQVLWKLNLHWDESLPMEIHSQWAKFQEQLCCVNAIQIKRYVPIKSSNVEIHGFSDASQRAYGAVIYIRTQEKGQFKTHLLCAKSRVAPIKEVSLPRLELCAALLLAELMNRISTIFNSNGEIDTYCWSDSTIVLAWLASEPCRWTTFISNRVSKIQKLSHSTIWQHIPTDHNPADLVSRGVYPNELAKNSLWFHGPEFLSFSKDTWPTSPTISDIELPEQRKQRLTLITSIKDDLITSCKYHNNYLKLLRVFCFILRFIRNSRKGAVKVSGALSPQEMESALTAIIRYIQTTHYKREYNDIKHGKPIHRTSSLRNLTPIISDGLIRVGGRIHRSPLAYDAAHPILLPPSHPFVSTMINYLHRKNLHAGCQTLTNIMRERFWIVAGRKVVRKVIHRCLLCFRARPLFAQQIMSSLPRDRVTPARPFYITGVDYCGPVYVSQRIRGRAVLKSYIAIFVCFTTKAVHLELVTDLSTAAFIAALKRFVARRGKPSKIYSDNATNFTGADRSLKELQQLASTESHNIAVQQFCTEDSIQWKFIPPRSPHFGGLWESAVKIAKYHLRRIVANSSLSFEELNTICCQVEAIMNSRPLTSLSNDPNDFRALTPGHFLIGGPLTAIPELNVSEQKYSHLRRYQYMQWLQQSFWARWQKEYLQELQQRRKWQSSRPNLQPNDLVLLRDENLPPLKWSLGRIIEVHKGVDGYIRVLTIRISTGLYKRAVTQVSPLPDQGEAHQS